VLFTSFLLRVVSLTSFWYLHCSSQGQVSIARQEALGSDADHATTQHLLIQVMHFSSSDSYVRGATCWT